MGIEKESACDSFAQSDSRISVRVVSTVNCVALIFSGDVLAFLFNVTLPIAREIRALPLAHC